MTPSRAAQEEPTSPRTEGHYAFGLRDGGSEWHVGPVGACCRREVTVPMDLLEVVGKALYGWGDDEPNEATGYTAVYEATKLAAAIHEAGYRREAAAATPSLDAEQAIEFLDGIVSIAERPDDQRASHKDEMAAIRWMATNAVRTLYESLARLDEGSATPEEKR